jgi:hypothetical protein
MTIRTALPASHSKTITEVEPIGRLSSVTTRMIGSTFAALIKEQNLINKENGKTPRRQSSFGRMLTKGLKILRSKLGMNSTNFLILKEMIKGLPETTQGEPI